MKYTALLAILAIAFAAPAPEHQVVIDNPATYDEHKVNTQHVEVNLYLNGAEKPPVDTSTAFRCYYCGNQATNDLRTTAVCNTAGGKTKLCGSKEDGLGCVHSKYTQAQFARQCGIVGCISDAKTCSSSSSKPSVQEETNMSDDGSYNNPSSTQRCVFCGNQDTDDKKTAIVCQKGKGSDQSCGKKGPMSCVKSNLNNVQFAYECGQVGCKVDVESCPSSSGLDGQKETPGFDANVRTSPQISPVEVKVYVNEL